MFKKLNVDREMKLLKMNILKINLNDLMANHEGSIGAGKI